MLQVTAAESNTAVREAAMGALDMFIACGFTLPIPTMTLRDVPLLIECVTLHATILIVKAELDQIIEGLTKAGVLETIRGYPQLFQKMFVDDAQPLTASESDYL